MLCLCSDTPHMLHGATTAPTPQPTIETWHTMCDKLLLSLKEACTCRAGHYCPTPGLMLPCPPGTFCPKVQHSCLTATQPFACLQLSVLCMLSNLAPEACLFVDQAHSVIHTQTPQPRLKQQLQLAPTLQFEFCSHQQHDGAVCTASLLGACPQL